MAANSNKTQFAQLFAQYEVTQLVAARQMSESGVEFYMLPEGAFVGNHRWVSLSLFSPQISNEGDIQVKLSLSYLQGSRSGRKIPNAVILGSGSTDSNWKNLNTGYVALEDLFATGCLSSAIFERVANWATANATPVGMPNGEKLSLIPSPGGYFAFNLRVVLNPLSGELAKSPIGINEFELVGFGLNSGSSIRSFVGGGVARREGNFAVRATVAPQANLQPEPIANPIDDGMEDSVYVPTATVPMAAGVIENSVSFTPGAMVPISLGDFQVVDEDDVPF